MIRQGSSGDQVRQLQQALAAAGFNPGSIDGVFGSNTAKAMAAWRASRGFNTSGPIVVGPDEVATLTGAGGQSPSAAPSPGGELPPEVQLAQLQIQAEQKAAEDQLRLQQQQFDADERFRQQTMAAQNAELQRQRMAERAGGEAEISGLTAQLGRAKGDLSSQLGMLETNRIASRSEAEQQGTQADIALQRQMRQRGLGSSGIRLGAQGRGEEALLKRLGGIDTQAQQQATTLNQQFAGQAGGLESQIASIRARLGLAAPNTSTQALSGFGGTGGLMGITDVFNPQPKPNLLRPGG